MYVYQRKLHRKKSGPKTILDNKDKLAIKRRIAILKSDSKKVFSNKIKNDCGVLASARTILRHLTNLGITYRNVKRKIFLTKAHRERIVEMARKWITNNHN